ncbi:MAG: hypothetical protein PVH50_01105 [Anaerolineae bacterium]
MNPRVHPHVLLALVCILAACASRAPTAGPPASPTAKAASTKTSSPLRATASALTSTIAIPQSPTAWPTSTRTSTPTPTATPTPMPTLTPTPHPDQLVASPGTAWNFDLIDHNALGAIGSHGGLALKDDCTYVGNYRRSAVAIVNISDPAEPSILKLLELPRGTSPVELRAVPDLDLLVASDLSAAARLLTYDVSDCAAPKPLGSTRLVGPAHEFYLWRNATELLAYAAMFDHRPPDLTVVNLTDPSQPQEVARWTAAAEGVTGHPSLIEHLRPGDKGVSRTLARRAACRRGGPAPNPGRSRPRHQCLSGPPAEHPFRSAAG